MEEGEEAEQPVRQSLRVVQVLDCVPGHADAPGRGQPIAILTLGHGPAVESPLMLHLSEVRKLVDLLMEVLEHFEDATDTSVQPVVPCLEKPSSPTSPSPLLRMQATGLTLTIRFDDRTLKDMHLDVLGGYRSRRRSRSDKAVMLLYRCDFGGEPVEALLKVMPGNVVRLKGHSESEALPRVKWAGFSSLPEGRGLCIGRRQRVWTKMTVEEMRELVSNVAFRIDASVAT